MKAKSSTDHNKTVNPNTLTCAPSMLSSLPVFLSGDGDATIVDSGLANCDTDNAGDFELTSRRRDGGREFTVCRLTAESIKRLFLKILSMEIIKKPGYIHTE